MGVLIVNIFAVLGALGFLVLSLSPGFAGGYFVLLVLPLVGLLGIGWMLVAGVEIFSKRRLSNGVGRRLLIAPILVCITYGLVKFYVPRRISFLVCRSAFDQCLGSVPTSNGRGVPFGRRLGIYYVDEYAASPNGGVYFRTRTTPDGLGPDTMSYGFVYQPNGKSTPFGGSSYVYRWIVGEWYWFGVSDD